MMEAELRTRLAHENQEYRRLAEKHRSFDEQLQKLSRKLHLTPNEQVERTRIKKHKLQLKDRMEAIVRAHRGGH